MKVLGLSLPIGRRGTQPKGPCRGNGKGTMIKTLTAFFFAGCAFVAGPAVAWVTRTPRVGQASPVPAATVASAVA